MTAKKTGQPCPYCNAPTTFIDSKIIYGRWYGWLLACTRYPQCDAYVGCEKGTKRPLGRLANAELRAAKLAAHNAFDPTWRDLPGNRHQNRRQAYHDLAKLLGIPMSQCHIADFDVEQCRRVVQAVMSAKTEPLPNS
jgi:ssDNA-binding Zn-finger/Zn-ribbon topoisomerase 1